MIEQIRNFADYIHQNRSDYFVGLGAVVFCCMASFAYLVSRESDEEKRARESKLRDKID